MSTSSLGRPIVVPDTQSAAESQADFQAPPTRWRRLVARSAAGTGIAVSAAFGLWAGDVLVLLFGRGGATWRQWVTGVGAALFVATTAAAVIGAVIGPVVLPIANRSMTMVREWWVDLDAEHGERSRALAARVLAATVLTGIGGLIAYRVVFDILFGIARADTTEIALTLSHLTFAAAALLAWRMAVRGSRPVVDAAARVRGFRSLLSSTWRVVTCFAALVLGLATPAAVVYRHELAALPWLEFVPLLGIPPALLVMRHLASTRDRRIRVRTRAGLVLFGLVLAASAVAAFGLRPQYTTARVIAFERALSGRMGYAAWTSALDFDRDGQINVLGGGDCAPFDVRRHTGATDIPGNKIDEDCDGVDTSSMAFRPRTHPWLGKSRTPARPNIVLITVDALGAPRLSALGSPVPLMPNVDRFAADSMLFSHCFAQGPSTRLSFPSMFTSRWDSELVFSYAPRIPYSLGRKERQLQDLADDNGYDTVAIVPDSYFDKSIWPSVTRGFQRVDASAVTHGKHNAVQVTDEALRALTESRQRPFYMWVHYYDAHPPYAALPDVQYTDRSDKGLYEAEVTHIDHELKRLLDAIDQRSDPTYVILTADHSTVFHPNPQSRKFHYGYDLYTATLHVPLVIHGPGIKPGRVDDLVSTMDVAPTVLDLMGARVPPELDGTSLTPELTMGQRDPKRILFHEFYLPEFVLRGKDPLQIVSVRDGRWDLILDRGRGHYELYDWTVDYFEQHDLYETMAFTQEVGHLRSMLGAFIAQFDNRRDTSALVDSEPGPGER